MPALIRVFCLLSVLFSTLSACSDSSSSASDTQVQGRTSSLGTPFAVIEGNAGKRSNLPITFTSPVSGTISYETFSVTAAQKSDFIPLIGEIDLVAGDEYTIIISVQGDDEIEGDELIGLSLKQDGKLIDEYFGLILNDDLPKLDITTTAVLEGDTGTSLLRFVFELQENTVDPYTFSITTPMVDIASNNPAEGIFYAVPGIDFQAINQPITFTKDLPSISVDVVVNSDNVIELDELVAIQAGTFNDAEREALLSSLGQVIGEQGLGEITANGIIRTDDSIDINGFDLKSVSGSAKEGNSDDIDNLSWTQVTYTIEVENPDNIIDDQVVQIKLEGLDINIGESGWAMPGLDQDYCANNPSVPLENGQIECSTLSSYPLTAGTEFFDISFYVRADLDVEGENEDIKIIIQNDQGVTFGEFFHSIEEDDYPSIMVTYNTDSAGAGPGVVENFEALIEQGIKVNEGTILTLGLNLEYPQSALYELTYELANDESTAIDSGDYPIVLGEKSGTISIPVGNIEGAKLQINIDDDSEYEGIEKFTLEIDGIGVIPISIIDNDLPELKVESAGVNKAERNEGYTNFVTPFTLPEQGEVEAGITPPATKSYDFNVFFAENKQARTDLNFSYTIDDSFFVNQKEALEELSLDCSYLSSAGSKQKANIAASDPFSENDYRVFINNNEKQPGVTELISKGQSGLSLRIQVNNDLDVECLEFLSLNFILEPDESELNSKLTVQFEIPNEDKAVLQVSGWSVDEGSTDEQVNPLKTTKAFTLALSQSLNTDIEYTLAGTDLNCDAEDATGHEINKQFNFGGTEGVIEQAVIVDITQDNVVEPDETCGLKITSFDENLVEVKYFNEIETGGFELNESLDPTAQYASGIIINDDLLNITVNTPILVIAEPEPINLGDASALSIGTYSWDKSIAKNVGEITITATQQNCENVNGIDCIESSDTDLGAHTSESPATQAIVIHTGQETEILTAQSNSLPISVLEDNVVEDTETFAFQLSVTAGAEYVTPLAADVTTRTIEITSADSLLVYLEERVPENSCSSNDEQACERVFDVIFNEDNISDQIDNLSVVLNINTDNTANIKKADNSEYVDAIVSIKPSLGANFEEVYANDDNEFIIDVFSAKTVQKPVIKITFISDEVVEIDEILRLDLITGTSTTPGIKSISQTINNDDFLNVLITGARVVNEPSTKSIPFTLTWDKEIDIKDSADLPVIVFKTSDVDCDGDSSSECLSQGDALDYVLTKGGDNQPLAQVSLVLDNPPENESKSLALDYLQLNVVDNLVELPEKLSLVLLTDSTLVVSMVQSNGTSINTDDITDINKKLEWDLTINSNEQLTLIATSVLDNIAENCLAGDATCTQTKHVSTISFDGDVQVADNGPSIQLTLSNTCSIDANNTENCAIASNTLNINSSETDFKLNHTGNVITLHSYQDIFSNASQDIELVVNNDNWVEVSETLSLLITPSTGSSYISNMSDGNGGSMSWTHAQGITLSSEDKANISLTRLDDLNGSTCIFNENTTQFTEDNNDTAIACESHYSLSTSNPIAKEVELIEVNLTRQNDTSATFKTESGTEVFDVQMISNGERYETGSDGTEWAFVLPVHTRNTTNSQGQINVVKLIYSADSLVERDEILNYQLEKGTSSAIYSVLNVSDDSRYTINETLLNNDFANLVVSGSNTQAEPGSAVNPYTLTWDKEFELPAGSLPQITIVALDTCSADESLECLEADADYTLEADASTVALTTGTTQKLTMNYLSLNAPDLLVELPELLNLQLTTSSPYIESVSHIGAVDNVDDDIVEVTPVLAGLHTLNWGLTVNSEDKLTVTTLSVVNEITEASISSCDFVNNPNCATKAVSIVKVDGTVATNGPTINLSVNNACVDDVSSNPANYCASQLSLGTALNTEGTINSSESDFVFNDDYTSINIHSYGEDYAWSNIGIDVTLNNDDWVEVTENINLNYTATVGGSNIGINSYITALPENQAVTLTSDDVANVTVSRNDVDSTCKFIVATLESPATNTFNEGGTEGADAGCTSHYQLSISAPISKEVGSINAALQLFDTAALNGATAVSFVDDVSATIDSAAISLTGSQLVIPIHTLNSATTTTDFFGDTLLIFSHKEDLTAEGNELLGFNLVESTAVTSPRYYSVSGSALTETVINDDSLIFTLTAPVGIDTDTSTAPIDIAEAGTGVTTTTLMYTLDWSGVAAVAFETLTLDFAIGGTATQGVDVDYSESSGIDYTITLGQGDSSPISVTNNTIIFTPTGTSGSETITFNIKGDATVELPETITATLGISDVNTAAIAMIGSSADVAINIPNDDFVTVTLYSNNSLDEGSDSPASTYEPFSYSIDKDIAENVPSIQLHMSQVTCPMDGSYNCAEAIGSTADNADLGDFYIDNLNILNLHTLNAETLKNATVNGDGTGDIIPTPISELYVRGDSRIEDNETIEITFDKAPSGVTLTGTDYIADILQSGAGSVAVATSLTLESIIKNDDKFSLKIDRSDYCSTYFDTEGDECTNRIIVTGFSSEVDGDVGEISLPIYHAGTAINQALEVTVNGSLVTKDPQDYKLELKFNGTNNNTYTEQTTHLILKASGESFIPTERRLRIKILDDDFIENSETIQFDLDPITHQHSEDEVHAIDNEHVKAIEFNHQSNTLFGQQQSITDNDSLTVTVAAASATERSFDIDGSEVLTDVAHRIEGFENTYKYISYTATLSNPVAPDYGTITLDLEDHGTDNIAVDGTDFTVARIAAGDTEFTQGRSVSIHKTGTSTPDNALIKTFRFEISADTTLELDELISQDLSLAGSTATLTGPSNLQYTILSDDRLTVTFAGKAAAGVMVKDPIPEGTSTDTDTSIGFDFTTDVEIPADYPDLNIILTNAGTSKAEFSHANFTDDATLPSTRLHKNTGSTPTAAITSGVLALTIKADAIVEPLDTLIVNLTSNTGGIDFKDEDGIEVTSLSQAITNDDFIQLELEPTSTGDLNEGDTVAVNITTNYESEELTELERQIGFVLVGSGTTASANDYTIASKSTLPVNGNIADTDQLLLTIKPDYIIENIEELNLTLSKSGYVQNLNEAYSYNIANDDYLTVERTTALIEGSNFEVKFCVPAGEGQGIQDGSGDLMIQMSASEIDATQSSSFKKATCADISITAGQGTCDLTNGFTTTAFTLDVDSLSPGNCATQTLFQAVDNQVINQNTAFKINLLKEDGSPINDVRLDLNSNSDPSLENAVNKLQEIVIINDDFLNIDGVANVLDTGLTQCIDNGITAKNPISCSTDNLQDAKVTDGSDNPDQYKDLAYTYINENGDPVITKPTSDNLCIQDNNTGFIWNQTFPSPDNGFAGNITYSSRAEGQCGFVEVAGGSSWGYPSVADLLNILDVSKLGMQREFDFKSSGAQNMRYWSGESCGGSNYFAVDFLSGEVSCLEIAETSFGILVYK
jgi:hypothetical protein